MPTQKSNFAKMFILLLLVPATIMLIGIFIDAQMVSISYFVALLICVAFLIIDKHNSSILTNYKLTFSLTEIINLIAICAVVYYEFTKNTLVLNITLIILIAVEVAMLVLDIFFIKNNLLSKYEGTIVTILKIGSFICILTYFYKVSSLWFAIDALLFEITNLGFKIYIICRHKKLDEKDVSVNEEIENRIHSAGENEGETE